MISQFGEIALAALVVLALVWARHCYRGTLAAKAEAGRALREAEDRARAECHQQSQPPFRTPAQAALTARRRLPRL